MEEERVVRLGTFNQPLHSTHDVGLRWHLLGIPTIVCQDQNVLLFETPVPCEVGYVGETAIYVVTTGRTLEERADVLGIVHTAVQFPGLSRIVDSDLNGCGVRQRQIWCKSKRENLGGHVHTQPSSSPYISSSGRFVDRCGRAAALGQEAVLGRES